MEINDWINLATPFVAPLVTLLWLKWNSKLPSWLIPPLCVALGTLGAILAKLAAGTDLAPGESVFLSMAGIGVRELQDQLRKRFVPPAPQPESKPDEKPTDV